MWIFDLYCNNRFSGCTDWRNWVHKHLYLKYLILISIIKYCYCIQIARSLLELAFLWLLPSFTAHTIARIGYSKYGYPHGYPDPYPNQYPKIPVPKYGFGYESMKMGTIRAVCRKAFLFFFFDHFFFPRKPFLMM